MNSCVKKVINSLECGELPSELNFSQPNQQIDEELIRKIQYNSFYKTDNFWINKFPNGFLNLPGSEKIIEHIKEHSLTPLEEINFKSDISNQKIKYDPYII